MFRIFFCDGMHSLSPVRRRTDHFFFSAAGNGDVDESSPGNGEDKGRGIILVGRDTANPPATTRTAETTSPDPDTYKGQ